MAQFTFLKPEFPAIYESAHKAFRTAYRDPRTACFYARRALELTVTILRTDLENREKKLFIV